MGVRLLLICSPAASISLSLSLSLSFRYVDARQTTREALIVRRNIRWELRPDDDAAFYLFFQKQRRSVCNGVGVRFRLWGLGATQCVNGRSA